MRPYDCIETIISQILILLQRHFRSIRRALNIILRIIPVFIIDGISGNRPAVNQETR